MSLMKYEIPNLIIARIIELKTKDPKTVANMVNAEFQKHYSEKMIKNILNHPKIRNATVSYIPEGLSLNQYTPIILELGEKEEIRGEITVVLNYGCGHCFVESDLDKLLEDRNINPLILEEIDKIKSAYGSAFKVKTMPAWMDFIVEIKDEDDWYKYGEAIENAYRCFDLSIYYFPAIILFAGAGEGEKGKIVPYQVRDSISPHHVYETVKFVIENKLLPDSPIPTEMYTTKYKGKKSWGFKIDSLISN